MKLDLTVEELRELCSGSICSVCASKREIVAEPPKEDCQQEQVQQYEPHPTDIASAIMGDPTDFFAVGTWPRVELYTQDGKQVSSYGAIQDDSVILRSYTMNVDGRILFNPMRYEDNLRNVTYPIWVEVGGFSQIHDIYFLCEDSHFSEGMRGKVNIRTGGRIFYAIPFVCDESGNVHFESKNPFASFAGVLSKPKRIGRTWSFDRFSATFSHRLELCAPYDVSVIFVDKLDVPVVPVTPTLPFASFEEIPEYLAKTAQKPVAPVFVSDPPVEIEVVYVNKYGMQCKIGRDADFFPANQKAEWPTERVFVGEKYAISRRNSDLILMPLSESCLERYGRAVSSHWAFNKIKKISLDARNGTCFLAVEGDTFFTNCVKYKVTQEVLSNRGYTTRLEFGIDSVELWPLSGDLLLYVIEGESGYSADFVPKYSSDTYEVEVEVISLPISMGEAKPRIHILAYTFEERQ